MKAIPWTTRSARGPARRLAAAGVVAAAVALAGCATGPRLVQTEVTAFNEFATLPTDRTYAFARTLEFRNSLEVQAYEDMVRDELALQGFKQTPETQAALSVTLRPSTIGTRVRIRDAWPDPYWGGYGGYGFGGFGGFGGYGRGFGGYGPYGPYGSPFYDRGGYSVEVFQRRLELDIDSKTVAGKRYYQGRAETGSEAESMQAVVPSLVRALFTDFPGNSGQTRRVDIPVERR